jgi:hypothetical protein
VRCFEPLFLSRKIISYITIVQDIHFPPLDKADKRAERMRHEKQEQERQDREDELREMAIKLRRR